MPAFGVYPIADALGEGDQISSTYEGRHLTFLESELTHAPGLAFVTKGRPVCCGDIVGIPFKTCTAVTDEVAIDTEGIWIVDVHAIDDGGNIAVAGGDVLYINTTSCVVSKIATAATQIPFGIALGIITTPGNIERIAVKIHNDPVDNWVRDLEEFYFGDGLDTNLQWAPGIITAVETLLLTNDAVGQTSSAFQIKATGVAGTQDVGIAAYLDATIGGQSTGNWVYAAGIWLNLATTFDESSGGWGGHEQLSPLSLGIYGTTLTDSNDTDIIYGAKCEYIMATAVHGIAAFALNVAGPTVAVSHTSIFFAHQNEAVGLTGTKSGAAGGAIALCNINGVMYWVNTFTS